MKPAAGLGLLLTILTATAFAEDDKAALAASIERGDATFHKYCVLCHGPTAEGNGRLARVLDPKPANLRKSMRNDLYKEMIIHEGGENMGRSKFMPSWKDELSDDQIHDVVHYLRTIAPPDADKD